MRKRIIFLILGLCIITLLSIFTFSFITSKENYYLKGKYKISTNDPLLKNIEGTLLGNSAIILEEKCYGDTCIIETLYKSKRYKIIIKVD